MRRPGVKRASQSKPAGLTSTSPSGLSCGIHASWRARGGFRVMMRQCARVPPLRHHATECKRAFAFRDMPSGIAAQCACGDASGWHTSGASLSAASVATSTCAPAALSTPQVAGPVAASSSSACSFPRTSSGCTKVPSSGLRSGMFAISAAESTLLSCSMRPAAAISSGVMSACQHATLHRAACMHSKRSML